MLIKARAEPRPSGLPTLADDSGLIVPRLGGAPGVYSSRYAGPEATDRDNWQALLKALEGPGDRRAAFYCVLVLMIHPDDPCPRIAEGLWAGEIVLAPEGEGASATIPSSGYLATDAPPPAWPRRRRPPSPIGAAPWPP